MKDDFKIVATSFLIVIFVFCFGYVQYALGEGVTLTVTVATALSFTTTTNNFGTLTPGTFKFATTTLSVTTNDVNGWNVTLYGDDQSPTNTVCDLDTDASVGITDQTEWVDPAATTTVGNAVRISSLDNSADVLAFRVMTASGSVPFLAPSWWGTTDTYADSATTLFAGVASNTVQRKIGNAGAGSYQAAAHLNSVLYYLDVASTQPSGAYGCPLTYTATGN
jgi:hypothetical protein